MKAVIYAFPTTHVWKTNIMVEKESVFYWEVGINLSNLATTSVPNAAENFLKWRYNMIHTSAGNWVKRYIETILMG